MPESLSGFSNTVIIATVLILVLCGFVVLNLVLFYFKRKRHLEQENILRIQFSQTLLQSQIEIQEQTLQHIGTELHDNLGQIASVIKLTLHTIRFDDLPKAKERIEDTAELTRQLIAEMRSLSVSLQSDRAVQRGLTKAIQTELERINRTEQFITSFEAADDIPELDDDTTLILFRMVQEMLNNAIKHSMAKHISLKLFSFENKLTLLLSDDGKGFDMEDQLKKDSGSGLFNLRKRAALIKANIHLQSFVGNGTDIRIELPLSS